VFSIGPARRELPVSDRPHLGLWYSLGQEESYMPHVELDVPDEVLLSLKERADEFARDVKLLAAVKLFELGKLSSGRAAQLECEGQPRCAAGCMMVFPSI